MPEIRSGREFDSILDKIIWSRRSIRSFKDEAPPEEQIKSIIRAGMQAPYAPIVADPKSDFRRFFVIRRGGKTRKEIATFMNNQAKKTYIAIKQMADKNPQIAEKSKALIQLLRERSENGLPNLEKAPYFVIVAEEKGPMPLEQWSIAHCLENMWLKVTALGLGMELISATEQMSDNSEFCGILGIPPGRFGLNGCLIGYPQNVPPATPRPDSDRSTLWLD